MILIILFGPPAVGKMTVGTALSRLTGFPLFHNHVAIEAVRSVFPFEHPAFWPLVGDIRQRMFQAAAVGGPPGLIFTFVWGLDLPEDKAYIDGVCSLFEAAGATVRFVELKTTLAERLIRNEHPGRLAAKPSKRDTERSRKNLLDDEGTIRMNSAGDFYYPDQHLIIDNTAQTPDDVALQIAIAWNLPTAPHSPK